MRRLFDLWEGVLVTLMTGMLALFTLVVAYQVFSRYVDAVPRFFWTEEVARFSFIWMLFLGAAVAVRRQTHFVIDLVPERWRARHGRWIDAVALAVVVAVAAAMVTGGIHFVQMGMRRISTISGIPLAWIYLAIPVSGLSMIAFALEQLWRSLRPEAP
jgi:TRAP-type C4-dicarboxylate transport system permease small subunit